LARVTRFSTEQLADALNVSYRTLHRRFRDVIAMAPLSYLQALGIKLAKELLEPTAKSIEQNATAVGYADISSLRRTFMRLTDVTPAQYRKKFHRS